MAQITSVTSESLQAKIRQLLPSQQGFGEDLQASNVILPVIDLTETASGSSSPLYQQQALAFGSQTAFSIENTTTVIANTPGFYRVVGAASMRAEGTPNTTANLQMSDGLTVKIVWNLAIANASSTVLSAVPFDLVFFLASGISLSGSTDSDRGLIAGSVRQVADVNGTIVNPSGFTPQ